MEGNDLDDDFDEDFDELDDDAGESKPDPDMLHDGYYDLD
jgi:phosphoglycolate phosphatase-like HAD superfamily hydrolase